MMAKFEIITQTLDQMAHEWNMIVSKKMCRWWLQNQRSDQDWTKIWHLRRVFLKESKNFVTHIIIFFQINMLSNAHGEVDQFSSFKKYIFFLFQCETTNSMITSQLIPVRLANAGKSRPWNARKSRMPTGGNFQREYIPRISYKSGMRWWHYDLYNKNGWNEWAGNHFNLDDEFDLGDKGRNMRS